ncbi:MAG TPA: hypothetical protein VIW03_09705 [Anaeromyxobacter sp.]
MASVVEETSGRPSWRPSWTAVIAGALLAIALHVMMGLVGAAIGLAAAPADSKALGAGAAVWALLTPFVASLLGAWLACRIAGASDPAGASLHGVLVWCIGLVAGALFLTGTLASGALSAGAAASGNARTVERARGDATGQRTARDARARSEDAATVAAASTGAAALASIAGLVGALAGSGLALRRGGRGAGWLERREGRRPSPGTSERSQTAGGTYTAGTQRTRVEPPTDVGVVPPEDPYHH